MRRVLSICLAVVLFLISGCGVSVKQVGNKIYTDVNAETAYAYARIALSSKGFGITQSSQDTLTIKAKGALDDDSEPLDVVANVNSLKSGSEVVVTVFKEKVEDKQKSEKLVAEAIREIIKELDKYGKFAAREEKVVSYPLASKQEVDNYIKGILANMSKEIELIGDDGKLLAKAIRSTHSLNEAMQVSVEVFENDDKSIDVKTATEIKGNYDIAGNKVYMQSWLDRFTSLLRLYPLAAQNFKYRYHFIPADKSVEYSLNALKSLNYLTTNQGKKVVAFQEKIKVVVTVAEFVDSAVLDIDSFAEDGAKAVKANLDKLLIAKMNALREELSKYQAYISAEKLFASVNPKEMVAISRKTLKNLGYKNVSNEGNMVTGYFGNFTAVVKINDLGREGLSVEIISVYNGKNPQSKSLVKAESKRLLAEFGHYDRMDLK